MRRVLIAVLLVISFLAVNWALWNMAFLPKAKAPSDVTPEVTPLPSFAITKLDNGIVYIQAEGDDYLKALQAFYTENGNQYLHCDFQGAIEKQRNPGWKADGNHVFGYILRCHDLAIPAQDVTIP